MRVSPTFPTPSNEPSVITKKICKAKGTTFEEFRDESMEVLLSEPFFSRRLKMLCRPDGFMLNCELGVNFFSTSELLYPKKRIRSRPIRARPDFYMISENSNASLGIVDCSLYVRHIALKDGYHRKRMDMLAYALVEFNCLETAA